MNMLNFQWHCSSCAVVKGKKTHVNRLGAYVLNQSDDRIVRYLEELFRTFFVCGLRCIFHFVSSLVFRLFHIE